MYLKEMLSHEAQGTGNGFGLFTVFVVLGNFFVDSFNTKLGTIKVARVFVI